MWEGNSGFTEPGTQKDKISILGYKKWHLLNQRGTIKTFKCGNN